MERGGGSGERSRIAAKTPPSYSVRDGLCRTVSCTGTRRNFQKRRSKVIVSDSESSDEFVKPSVDRKTLVAKGKAKDKVDVFEFDEYDGFDSANLRRKRFDNGSVGVSGGSSFAATRVDSYTSVGRSGSSGRDGVFVRRKKPYVNGAMSSESDSDEPVRLQGRNGVLKLKVNNQTSTLAASVNHQEEDMYERSSSSRKVEKRENVVVKPSFRRSMNSETIRLQGRNGVLKLKVTDKTTTLAASANHQEAEIYERPFSSSKVQKRENVDKSWESEESDRSRRCKRKKPECQMKPGVREERRERRGGGTEKQRLREKVKGLLIDAGWTVDYRPRRNRSYMDAVYVNPSGVAYWSIIKAYDALRKQLKDQEIDARSVKATAAAVASVSEDVVNSLARKVKKTQTEMTKQWKKDFSGSESEKESDTRRERMGSEKSNKRGRNGTDDLHSKSKRLSYYSDARPSSGSGSHYLHRRESKKLGRCTLKVRSSEDKRNTEIDGFNPYSGKRTLLSWLIECGVVQLRQKVQYMDHQCTKVMLEGWIARAGIHCVCCSKILSVSRFEIHAGSKSCQPFQNIYLESGSSLHHCQIKAWNMQKDATSLGFHHVDTDGDDPNDDACGICGDGGDLICCDGCPSTYHQTCLGMEVLPLGDWHCPNCTCKFCDAAVDSGGEEGNHLSLLSCNMCERRYHQSCMNELGAHNVQSFGSASFCGPKCLELFENLQKYLGVKNEIEGGYSWSLIHRMDTDSNSNSQMSAKRIENNSKLAVGLAIMDECFLPIIDRRSGVNLIRNVLYNCGSNFNRINYSGFYTAILERGDEIISAASLRFHGMQLAEMPFIGTRHIYRRQGMCRRLFDAIESAMHSLKVEKLVIPAIPDFLQAWTGNFGFTPLDESVRKEMRSLNTLVFPGISILQKPLVRL
ncbi:unnamed protein product [Microthlaspi erraticum]|uniref:PHD-type domain-containing protein n=1 Tax=Microthlaspi erraticum TaxID=1685480 RepID=A0A6D2IN12_9BRAS|nr:unnamed protein product [Microthlaspi erraticum]